MAEPLEERLEGKMRREPILATGDLPVIYVFVIDRTDVYTDVVAVTIDNEQLVFHRCQKEADALRDMGFRTTRRHNTYYGRYPEGWVLLGCTKAFFHGAQAKHEVTKARPPELTEPIAMLLWCPMCHTRHIDEGEFATKPHHTHACQNPECGLPWRPAIVCTVGVKTLPGFLNDPKLEDGT